MATLLKELHAITVDKPAKRVIKMILGGAELNERYAQIEAKHNTLASNWDWFIKAETADRFATGVAARIDQN